MLSYVVLCRRMVTSPVTLCMVYVMGSIPYAVCRNTFEIGMYRTTTVTARSASAETRQSSAADGCQVGHPASLLSIDRVSPVLSL
jgi:hypothetical protein